MNFRLQNHIPLLAGLLAYVLLYSFSCWNFVGFSGWGPFFDLLEEHAPLGILAIGMTFVILSGGIDLSVGAVMSLSTLVVAILIMNFDFSPISAFAVSLTMGTFLGACMGGLIHGVGIPPFIVTLAGMFFASGLGFVLHLETISINKDTHAAMGNYSWGVGGGYFTVSAMVFLVTVLIGMYIAKFTRFGRNVYALGGDEQAAHLMGLPIGQTRVHTYAVSGFCAALAGVVKTFYVSSGNHEGVGMELNAIAAVVVGGTLLTGGVGSVLGTLIGVLLIGTIETLISGGYLELPGAGYTKIAIGGVLLFFILLQRAISPKITLSI